MRRCAPQTPFLYGLCIRPEGRAASSFIIKETSFYYVLRQPNGVSLRTWYISRFRPDDSVWVIQSNGHVGLHYTINNGVQFSMMDLSFTRMGSLYRSDGPVSISKHCEYVRMVSDTLGGPTYAKHSPITYHTLLFHSPDGRLSTTFKYTQT